MQMRHWLNLFWLDWLRNRRIFVLSGLALLILTFGFSLVSAGALWMKQGSQNFWRDHNLFLEIKSEVALDSSLLTSLKEALGEQKIKTQILTQTEILGEFKTNFPEITQMFTGETVEFLPTYLKLDFSEGKNKSNLPIFLENIFTKPPFGELVAWEEGRQEFSNLNQTKLFFEEGSLFLVLLRLLIFILAAVTLTLTQFSCQKPQLAQEELTRLKILETLTVMVLTGLGTLFVWLFLNWLKQDWLIFSTLPITTLKGNSFWLVLAIEEILLFGVLQAGLTWLVEKKYD
ncbi:hypothetical protein AUJ78_00855 [Candidatus Peregrinibacteria bacterium CG1_02_41_10]|nr:MAG: hypothetical protein AUJ78_00855 [Candidatus Peregrinibacteria bacterium CG1_02_41_10]